MIERLLIHPHTKAQVAQFIERPSHAILLTGPNGSGKTCLATAIACAVLEQTESTIASYPYFLITSPDEKNTISIEAVRNLHHSVRLKTLGTGIFRRVLVIEHAQRMTTEAQNAYLILLEEPPADTMLIMTADSKQALLPTILSRVQTITVDAPLEEDCKQYFAAQGKASAAITQSHFLSGGLIGLMCALLDEDTTHPLTQGVIAAKQILAQKQFERLLLVDAMSKNKEGAKYTLEALQHIAQIGINQAAAKSDRAKLIQWHHILKTTTEATEALAVNANAKLVFSNLMLGL